MATTAAAPRREGVRSTHDEVLSAVWFIGLTLAFAFLVTVAVVSTGSNPNLLAFPLALGPALIALVLAWREGGGAVRRLLRGLKVLPREPVWYGVLLLPVAAFLVVIVIAVILGQPVSGMFDGLFPAIVIVPLVVLVPALAEELAWRGFALPRTMAAMPALRAALVIGVPWTLIHVGLFLPGQMNAGASYWSMASQILSMAVILAWVYLGTGGSILMAGLVHALFNGLVPLTAGIDDELAWTIRGVVWPVIAVLIVVLGGFRGLDRQTQPA
jgi:uncharacterized protein